MKHYERVCAKIDLDAICDNLEAMKSNLKPETKIMGVIKTDGYGHGAVPIAWEMEKLDYVYGYAVATVEEAMQLRNESIKKPILILGYAFPSSYDEIVKNDIRPAVFREDMLNEINEAAKRVGEICYVHIKVDTGMSRIGIRPDDEGKAFVKKALSLSNISVEGIFTHFARADESDKTSAHIQMDKFHGFVKECEQEFSYQFPLVHCSNSAGIVELQEANDDLVRAGITLYGLWPSDEVKKDIVPLRPVLTLESHITYIKEVEAGVPVSYGGTFITSDTTKIATIPVGYGDGYPRMLSGKGYVLIRGKKAPILGRVCMDQFMVDVTNIEDAKEGDLVTLIGGNGELSITMEEIGELSTRFNYELACDLGKRIPRVFIKNKKEIYSKDYFKDVSIEKIL